MNKVSEGLAPRHSAAFLAGRVSHLLRLSTGQHLAAANIPLSVEEHIVLTVVANLESPQRMEPLADLLGRDVTTLKRQLDGLVKAGLVARTRSSEDGRGVVVSVTMKGKGLVEHTTALSIAVRQGAMRGISQADYEVLVQVLSTMLDNLKKGLRDGVPSGILESEITESEITEMEQSLSL